MDGTLADSGARPGGAGRSADPGAGLAPADVEAVAAGRARVVLGPATLARIAASHERLAGCIAERRLVYGLTTGFGPLANRLVSPADGCLLQENLINHLASGVGADLAPAAARAVVLARLASIAQGWSGASPTAARLMAAMLNAGLAPCIPEKGTVGASGDLTPLAHVALALTGRGGFTDLAGAPVTGEEAFRRMGAAPLRLEARDGLALVNGTSAMTGIAALSAAGAARLADWAEALTVGIAELLAGRAEAWDEAFSRARPHPGQAAAAAGLRRHAAGARRIEARPAALRHVGSAEEGTAEARAAQDAYTLRCAPQVIGAARDAIAWHHAVVSRELNSATDNPLFPPDGLPAPALHGGNFMGSHVALASDALSNAVITLACLAERQIARVTDERLSEGLPPFLQRGPAGLNSGLMGAQVTATALLAEMRTRAVPASVQSISTNGANQDVVSMGTIAARGAAAHLEDARRIHAIAALCVAQGTDILAARGDPAGGPAVRIAGWVRLCSTPVERDRPLAADIAALAAAMESGGAPGPAA